MSRSEDSEPPRSPRSGSFQSDDVESSSTTDGSLSVSEVFDQRIQEDWPDSRSASERPEVDTSTQSPTFLQKTWNSQQKRERDECTQTNTREGATSKKVEEVGNGDDGGDDGGEEATNKEMTEDEWSNDDQDERMEDEEYANTKKRKIRHEDVDNEEDESDDEEEEDESDDEEEEDGIHDTEITPTDMLNGQYYRGRISHCEPNSLLADYGTTRVRDMRTLTDENTLQDTKHDGGALFVFGNETILGTLVLAPVRVSVNDETDETSDGVTVHTLQLPNGKIPKEFTVQSLEEIVRICREDHIDLGVSATPNEADKAAQRFQCVNGFANLIDDTHNIPNLGERTVLRNMVVYGHSDATKDADALLPLPFTCWPVARGEHRLWCNCPISVCTKTECGSVLMRRKETPKREPDSYGWIQKHMTIVALSAQDADSPVFPDSDVNHTPITNLLMWVVTDNDELRVVKDGIAVPPATFSRFLEQWRIAQDITLETAKETLMARIGAIMQSSTTSLLQTVAALWKTHGMCTIKGYGDVYARWCRFIDTLPTTDREFVVTESMTTQFVSENKFEKEITLVELLRRVHCSRPADENGHRAEAEKVQEKTSPLLISNERQHTTQTIQDKVLALELLVTQFTQQLTELKACL